MILPTGCLFRPTDEELLIHYLGRKRMGLPLPCDVVIEREIYGAGDKAPWQILTDQDPWEICKTRDDEGNIIRTEGTIYVFTTLNKAPGKTRIARTAGCGSWHGETAPKKVVDDNGFLIGHKKTLCFEITNESGLVMEEGVKRGHWIMHEYSVCSGDDSKGGYVVCRIKRDDSKFTKKSVRNVKNGEAAATIINDDHGMVPKPAKRARTEFVQEKKKKKQMECDIAAAPEAHQVVPLLEDVFVQDQYITMGDYPNKFGIEELDEVVGDLGGLVPVLEQQENFSFNYGYDACSNISFSTEVPSGVAVTSSVVTVPLETSENCGQHYYLNPSHVSAVHSENLWSGELPTDQQEQKMECDDALAPKIEVVPFPHEELFVEDESFIMGDALNEFSLEGLDELFADYDAVFANIPLTTEFVPSGVEASEDYGQSHLNHSDILVQNPVHTENLWGAEVSSDQESDPFWQPFTGFHATAEPVPI